jgi:hypothetical protein
MTFDAVPYGVNLTAQCYEVSKQWYLKSEATAGCKGVMERGMKACLVSPAHLITAALITPITMIYDLVLATFFLLANLCTALTFDELRERLISHVYSFANSPMEAIRNLMAALCPPIAYRGEDAINFSYAAQHQGGLYGEEGEIPFAPNLGFAIQMQRFALRNPEVREAPLITENEMQENQGFLTEIAEAFRVRMEAGQRPNPGNDSEESD